MVGLSSFDKKSVGKGSIERESRGTGSEDTEQEDRMSWRARTDALLVFHLVIFLLFGFRGTSSALLRRLRTTLRLTTTSRRLTTG